MKLIHTLLVAVFLLTTIASCSGPIDTKIIARRGTPDWILCLDVLRRADDDSMSSDKTSANYEFNILEAKRRGLDCNAVNAKRIAGLKYVIDTKTGKVIKKTEQPLVQRKIDNAEQTTAQTIEQPKGSTGLTAEQIALKLQLDRIEEKLTDIKRQAAKDKKAAKRAASDAEWDRSIERMQDGMRELIYK